MKHILKKITAAIMAVATVLALVNFSALTGAAADLINGSKVNVDCTYFADGAGYYYEYDFRGQNMVLPDGSLLLMFGGIPKLTANGKVAYCIKSNASAGVVDNTSAFVVSDGSIENEDLLDLALSYGFTGKTKYNADADVERIATQILIWCITDGWFDNASETKALNIYTAGMGAIAADVKSVYQALKSNVLNHTSDVPSFSSSVTEHKMTYNSSTKEWALKLTDTCSVTDKYDWDKAVSAYSDLSVNVTSDSITFTSTKKFSTRTLTAALKDDKYEAKNAVKLVPDGTGVNHQECIADNDGNIQAALVKLYAEEETGDLKIKKTSADGNVSGIDFTVKQGDVTIGTYTTGSNGEVLIENLTAGIYVVTESVPQGYEPQASKTVTVEEGKTTEVEFNNIRKTGSLRVTKNSEDGLAAGIKFHLSGTSDFGLNVNMDALTDANGVAVFENVYIGSGYTLTEVDTDVKYVVPAVQKNITVNWNKETNASVKNVLKKFTVTVSKVDKEHSAAQGDGALAGAVYGIYNNGTLVDKYTTDANGVFTTKEYICGDNWTIKEITPSEGYLLDPAIHNVGAEPRLYTVEHNTAPSITSQEQVKKGKFTVLKTTGNGTGAYEFETGAEFEVYLKSSGSYDNAKDYERDRLVCGTDGTATTKELPYGIYTVHQTKAWDGRQFTLDFDVFVGAENNDYKMFPLNNSVFESYIRIVKKDSETGNTIPYAGAGFQIYDKNGDLVTMRSTYPNNMEIDTFYTNSEGYLMTPETLLYGKGYFLQEVQAPKGYVINNQRIEFDVVQENSQTDTITVIEIPCYDVPQKGIIEISKFGEVFTTVVTNASGMYQPVYDLAGLEGAVYKVVAAEDIVTLDGTIRVAKGEEVGSITTDLHGIGRSQPLYLGKYNLIEVTAPYGMVIDNIPRLIEISYGGQSVEITTASGSFLNERQKLALGMAKTMEKNELFGLGMNDEILNVSFGLFAAEDIIAADGTKIPKDGLIETRYCDANGDISFKSDLPFGKYYVQELSTDKHYVLNEEKFTLTYDYQGQDTDIVNITVNNGTIINELIYGIAGGIKICSDTREGLPHAVIGLFPSDTTEFTAENAYVTVETDENGQFAFTNVPYGDYIVYEIEAPEGYALNAYNYNTSISQNGQTVDLTIIDDHNYSTGISNMSGNILVLSILSVGVIVLNRHKKRR